MKKLKVSSLVLTIYLLGCVAWPVLKLLGFATSGWWRVTALIWGPWLMLIVLAIVGLLLPKRPQQQL